MFKPGDKVKRVQGTSYGGVVVGGIYTVTRVLHAEHPGCEIELLEADPARDEERPCRYCAAYFELVRDGKSTRYAENRQYVHATR